MCFQPVGSFSLKQEEIAPSSVMSFCGKGVTGLSNREGLRQRVLFPGGRCFVSRNLLCSLCFHCKHGSQSEEITGCVRTGCENHGGII